MSVLGFEVHVDKENATYTGGINKGGPLKQFGLREAKGKFQPTPRKALFDVNYEPANVAASRNLGKNKLDSSSTDLKDGCFSALKPSLISKGAENDFVGVHNRKQDSKKTPSMQKRELKVLKDVETHPPKSKSTVKSKKLKPLPKPTPEVTDEDYDSDSIFPRTERLSSYVDKLLPWGVPCLFEPAPDSESENSDVEELMPDYIVLDMPSVLPVVPEFSDADLDSLMADCPPPVPGFDDHDKVDCLDIYSELYLDQASDTSFPFD